MMQFLNSILIFLIVSILLEFNSINFTSAKDCVRKTYGPCKSEKFCASCKEESREDSDCLDCNKECPLTTLTRCVHGHCNKSDTCICESCWKGVHCDEAYNPSAPKMIQRIYEITVLANKAQKFNKLIKAQDSDERKCDLTVGNCSCAQILYSMKTKSTMFFLDETSGTLHFKPRMIGSKRSKYILTVQAYNPLFTDSNDAESYANILVTLQWPAQAVTKKTTENVANDDAILTNEDFDFETVKPKGRRLLSLNDDFDFSNYDLYEVHSRAKRSTISGGVTFTNVVAQTTNTTLLQPGTLSQFSFQMTWPQASSINTRIEIIMPIKETVTPLFVVCNPSISNIGSNFANVDANILNWQWLLSSKFNNEFYDRAVLDMGNVVNNGTILTSTSNTITVTFSVLTLYNPNVTCGSALYNIVAGTRISFTNLWIAKWSYLCNSNTNVTSWGTPSFLFTGPSELHQGKIGVYSITLNLRQLLNTLTLDVYAPVNSTISVIGANIGNPTSGTGASYCCNQKYGTVVFYNQTLLNNVTGEMFNGMATISFGTFINTVIRNRIPQQYDDLLTIEVYGKMMPNSPPNQAFNLGVSLQYNNDYVWASLVTTNTLLFDPSTLILPSDPQLNFWTYFNSASVNSYVSFFFNITFPTDSFQYYQVEFLLPYNSTLLMQFVRIRVLSVGKNLPNLFLTNATISTMSSTNSSFKNYVIFVLGAITNIGRFPNPQDNILTLELVTYVLQDDGTYTSSVSAALRYNKTLWIGAVNIDLIPMAQNYTTDYSSMFSFINLSNNSIYPPALVIGSQQLLSLKIVIPVAAQLQTFYVELSSVFDNDLAVISFCDVRAFVGQNFLELTLTDTPFDINYISTAENGLNDRVIIQVRNTSSIISNIGRDMSSWVENDNQLRFEIKIQVNNHVISNTNNLLNNSLYFVGAGIQIEPNGYYVSQLLFTVDNTTSLSSLTSNINVTTTSPAISIVGITNSNVLTMGAAYAFNILMKNQPQTFADYMLSTTSLSNALSICSIQLVNSGITQPCLTGTSNTQYHMNNTQCDSATIQLTNFQNLGISEGIYSDADLTSEFQVVVQLNPNMILADNSPNILLSTFYAENVAIWNVSQTLTSSTANVLQSVQPMCNFYLRNFTGTVPLGSASVVVLDLFLPPKSLSSYLMSLNASVNSSDAGKIHICNVRIVDVGQNVACVNDTLLAPIYTASSFSASIIDQASITINYLSNVAQTGVTNTSLNKIRLEWTILIQPSALKTVNIGDKLWLSMTVMSGNPLSNQWSSLLSFIVVDPISVLNTVIQPTPLLNILYFRNYSNENSVPSTTELTGNVFDEFTFGLNFSSTEGFYNLNVEIYSDLYNGQGEIHFDNVFVSQWGANWGCSDNFNTSTVQYISSFNTSQFDKFKMNFGLLSNTGYKKRYDWKPYVKYIDNVIILKFNATITDCESNMNGSKANITIKVTCNNQTTYFNQYITIVLKPSNKPVLYYKSQLSVANTDLIRLQSGLNLTLTINLWHLFGRSNADLFNVSSNIYLPFYTKFGGLISVQGVTPFVVNNSLKGLILFYPKFFITDTSTVKINIMLNQDYALPDYKEQFYSSIPLDLGAVCGNKSSISYPVKDIPYIIGVDTQFFASDKICQDNLLLRQSSSIQDCQITASSYHGNNRPEFVRSSSGSWWQSGQRGPPFYNNEYLQIFFGNNTLISKIIIYPTENFTVTKMSYQFSDDGLVWFNKTAPYKTNTPYVSSFTFTNATSPSATVLDTLIIGRYVRFIPLSMSSAAINYTVRLNFDIFGCSISTDFVSTDVCTTSSTLEANDVYDRGYIFNNATGFIYVCMITDMITKAMLCSMSQDYGDSWIRLSEMVANVRYVDNASGFLYGTAANRLSRIKSFDNGYNWTPITDKEYNDIAALNNMYINKAIIFNFDMNVATPESNFNQFGMNVQNIKFSVDFNGFYRYDSNASNYVLKAIWST